MHDGDTVMNLQVGLQNMMLSFAVTVVTECSDSYHDGLCHVERALLFNLLQLYIVCAVGLGCPHNLQVKGISQTVADTLLVTMQHGR